MWEILSSASSGEGAIGLYKDYGAKIILWMALVQAGSLAIDKLIRNHRDLSFMSLESHLTYINCLQFSDILIKPFWHSNGNLFHYKYII